MCMSALLADGLDISSLLLLVIFAVANHVVSSTESSNIRFHGGFRRGFEYVHSMRMFLLISSAFCFLSVSTQQHQGCTHQATLEQHVQHTSSTSAAPWQQYQEQSRQGCVADPELHRRCTRAATVAPKSHQSCCSNGDTKPACRDVTKQTCIRTLTSSTSVVLQKNQQ